MLTATPLSRVAAQPTRPDRRSPCWNARLLTWHGICLLLMQSGCFYTLPFVEVEDDVPPEITITSPSAGDTLVISGPTAMAFVSAVDPDDDALFCQWFIEGYQDLGAGTPISNGDQLGCYIYVNNDADYDGRTLRCIIFDDSHESDEVIWPIDVLEEGT